MSNLPAHLAARHRPSMTQEALAGLSVSRGAHVSIADNRFTLVDSAGNERPIQMLYLDVVVVDVNPSVSRTYYDPSKPWVKGEGEAPLCFSDNGKAPSSRAQSPQSQICQLCPHAVWGSAKSKMSGKDIPACQSSKKLAVIVPGDPSKIVYQLKVPPASLDNWKAYILTLVPHGLEPYDAFTRLSFASQGVLAFAPAPIGEGGLAYVTPEIVALAEEAWRTKATIEATGKEDLPWTGQMQLEGPKEQYAQRANGQLPPPPNRPAAPPPVQEQPFGAQTTVLPPSQMAPADPFAQAGTSSPPAATPFVTNTPRAGEDPTPRTRKPRAPKAEPAPAADDGIPPFLQRSAAPPPLPAAPAAAFGMNPNPPAPDAGIQAALDAAFNLPT